jgi:hypothetical protein
MLIRIIAFLCYLSLIFGNATAQTNFLIDFEHKNYTWDFSRKLYPLTAQESLQPAVILKDKRIVEYAYQNPAQQELLQINTLHKIIRINTREAVQQYNKVYIPIHKSLTIIALNARFIADDGRITLLQPQHIKTLENINETGDYKIFAIEGIEIGGEIEYYYTISQKANFFGREVFQANVPTKEVDFELITPKNIIFETKSYNDFPAASRQTNYSNKNNWVVKATILSPQNNNSTSSQSMRIDFKLSHHSHTQTHKPLSWNEAGRMMAENIYISKKLNSTELTTYKQFVTQLTIICKTEQEKIIAIENFIKKNIYIDDKCNNEHIAAILENKCANKQGTVKLFALFFELANISHQLVLTANKNHAKFDKDFENWAFLEYHLFYFPALKLFLAPTHTNYTLGLVPVYLTAQDGLFIDYAFHIATTTLQEIPPMSAALTKDESEFLLNFKPQNFQIEGTCKKKYSGYYATALAYAYEHTENQQALSERIFRASIANAALADVKITTPINNFTQSDFFAIETSLLATTLIEKAGTNFLFRVGDLLAQDFKTDTLSNTVQSENKQTCVSQDFNKTFKRKIIFTIPQNYLIRNLENLKVNIGNDKQAIWFQADYVLENNQVEITITGGNNQLDYVAEDKEQLLQVVAAMKDFSQMVLVFQKIR